jgi:RNA polymerase sigma factor (sigma-70 family)
MKELSDKELAARVAATKDTIAFEELVRRHQNAFQIWLKQLSGHSSKADDIAQDTFISTWNNMHIFRGDGEFKSWLMKIAYTHFLQYLRKAKARNKIIQESKIYKIEEVQTTDNHALPDLQKLLTVLSLEEKACMVLCYSHGYSHTEISTITKLHLGTVKSHIRRGINKIQSKFKIGKNHDG